MADAGPIADHIADLTRQGMSLYQIAYAAGIGLSTVRQVHQQRYSRTTPATAARILAVDAQDPHTVDSTGTARRLQALGLAQYGLPRLSSMTGYLYPTMKRWQQQHSERVTILTRDTVRYLYEQLWCTDGPDLRAAEIAAERGWHPFEAWTDLSIDDPTAEPYGALEQRQYVDWEQVNRVLARQNNRVVFTDLSPAEQVALWRTHVANGGSTRGFRDRYRPVPIGIVRWLTQEVA